MVQFQLSFQAETFLHDYEKTGTIVKINVLSHSSGTWTISPPSRQALVDDLKSKSNISVRFRYVISRYSILYFLYCYFHVEFLAPYTQQFLVRCSLFYRTAASQSYSPQSLLFATTILQCKYNFLNVLPMIVRLNLLRLL